MIKEFLCNIKWIDKKSYQWQGFWSEKMPKWTQKFQYKRKYIWNFLWFIYSDIDFIKFIKRK